MSDFINGSDIEQMSEQELHDELYEIFNALAKNQVILQECEDLEAALLRIQNALYMRKNGSPKP